MFRALPEPPLDPILGLARWFEADGSPEKVDLGIGIYKDESGQAPILATVKAAERWLCETQTTKGYLSSLGNEAYNRLTRELIFGPMADAVSRSRTIQTPGGTGALRLGMEFLRRMKPGGRIFLPAPTWANHPAIAKMAGIEVVSYPYYDVSTGTLRFAAMMEALKDLREQDILLVHGCCHNPSGADLDAEQWADVAECVARSGAAVLVDLAYLGFADGLEADSGGLRILAARLPELVIASSYSKNFALYRERVGALTILAETERLALVAEGHVLPIARTIYSMPPDHGAAVVAHILGDAALKAAWSLEVKAMRERINTMRMKLVELLHGRTERDFAFLGRQRGMFALLGLDPTAVERLRTHHHVHMTTTARANVAGLSLANVDRVADAIVEVTQPAMAS